MSYAQQSHACALHAMVEYTTFESKCLWFCYFSSELPKHFFFALK